ncbi:hypothetical protein ACIHFD_54650 [Nonomuraea sp. NPDC051941]
MVQRAKKTIKRGDFASTLLVAVPEPSLPAGRAGALADLDERAAD